MHWDLFCRVIDNHGDAGVCWRLAADLASRGETIRLWIDDASALRWMAPGGHPGVQLLAWPEVDKPVENAADDAADTIVDAAADTAAEPGDVVIEAFGCELPAAHLRRMASAVRAPVWVNLEYLSAEAFVERAHRLRSPQTTGPGAGLRKWFFFPGFTPATGGLLRERDLAARQQAFDRTAWLDAKAGGASAGERVVSLFCYEQPALPTLLRELGERPTLLLVAAGEASRQVATLLGPELSLGALRAVLLPRLTQPDYDHLLWVSDLNFVRGEDSFVRAQWAGKPFVWQVYPQHDGAHLEKLDAFAARFDAGDDLRAFWRRWNGAGPTSAGLPPFGFRGTAGSGLASSLGSVDGAQPGAFIWNRQCQEWRASLLAQADLGTQLLSFVSESR